MTPPVGRAPPHQISLDRPHILRGGQWAENSHFAHTLAPVSSHWIFCGHTLMPSHGVFCAAPDPPEPPPPPGGAGSAAKNPRCDNDFQRSATAVSLRSLLWVSSWLRRRLGRSLTLMVLRGQTAVKLNLRGCPIAI